MSVECKNECPKESSYTVFFEYTREDVLALKSSAIPDIKTFYNFIITGSLTQTTPNTLLKSGDLVTGEKGTAQIIFDCDFNTNNMAVVLGMWILKRFGVNPKRICDAELTLLPDDENSKTLKMKFTMGPPIIGNNEKTYPNDKYSSECIKDIVLAWILQYDGNIPETDIEGWLSSTKGQQEIQKCTSYTSNIYNEIEYIPDIINPSLGKFSNIRIEQFGDRLIEEITNPGGFAGTSTPDTLLDYLFMYSLPVSFIGSIAYGVLSITQTDLPSFGINKNFLLAVYIYIFICGFLSLCVWYKIDIVDYKIGNIKLADWFSLGVIKLTN